MSKSSQRPPQGAAFSGYQIPGAASDAAAAVQAQLQAVATRYNREFSGAAFELPAEVEAMPIFQDWAAGKLQNRIASPFWELAKPKKNQRCLDLGCGLSFLVYPWREWEALFYGQDISSVAQEAVNSRGPQLNSKLFKGVVAAPAHVVNYEAGQFDLAIATGVSAYFSRDYWSQVLTAVKRVLKPEGFFIFDVVDPEAALAENWAILETYLGAEVFLEEAKAWEETIKAAGGKVVKTQPGELFKLYKVRF